MSAIEHMLPTLGVRNAGKATKRKKVKIPSMCGQGRRLFPDHAVGCVLWMHDRGWSYADLADLTTADKTNVYQWTVGITRPHCKPQPPDDAFWQWLIEFRATRMEKP